MRLCIDYRQLNARTKSDSFPTGNVLDVIENMAGARYFSTIDLAQGYHQVPVAEADREKTAFRTLSGLWEFTRMPFGLKGAPATFSRLMARVLGNMSPTQLALYMDDICVISASSTLIWKVSRPRSKIFWATVSASKCINAVSL